MLLEQAELRSPEREEGYISCGLLDRIRRLDICRDSRQLENLMKGLFGGSDEGNLGLRDFLSPGMRFPADLIPLQADPCGRFEEAGISSQGCVRLSF